MTETASGLVVLVGLVLYVVGLVWFMLALRTLTEELDRGGTNLSHEFKAIADEAFEKRLHLIDKGDQRVVLQRV